MLQSGLKRTRRAQRLRQRHRPAPTHLRASEHAYVVQQYLLIDHETDRGVKTGELVALLENLFEEPEAKAAVFSQWLGSHELIARRLAARG